MPDAKASKTKRMVERKKYPWLVNVLKESIGATIIIKRILDLGVNLTIAKLLTSTLVIEKQLTKTMTEDETM